MEKDQYCIMVPIIQNNLLEIIINTAEKNKVPFQRGAVSRATGTDTDAFAILLSGCIIINFITIKMYAYYFRMCT